MRAFISQAGLPLRTEHAPVASRTIVEHITEEAALTPAHGEELRLEPVASEGDAVRQGQPIARLRAARAIALTAPMAGRIASIQFSPGHRLVQIVLFREKDGDRHRFANDGVEGNPRKLRALMQEAGLWRMIRSRPFGHMPAEDEMAAAIFVMAADSRPGAVDPCRALEDRGEDFIRGLAALAGLTDGKVYLCARPGTLTQAGHDRVRRIETGALHPMGLAGLHIHRVFSPTPAARVWDVHAEDVADLGTLIATGHLPATRLVSVDGSALREARLVRCQPGADLRGLSQSWVKPGPHEVLSGSALDGYAAHWLGPRDRQASILPHGSRRHRRHWFQVALQSAARPLPVIPTAALSQALGGELPAAALVRALGAGDAETAVKLGALSLLEEDLALADYVTAANPPLSHQLRVLLDQVEEEEAE